MTYQLSLHTKQHTRVNIEAKKNATVLLTPAAARKEVSWLVAGAKPTR
jgi:hypothetical protein